MHIPNQKCLISALIDVDMRGKQIYSTEKREGCSVINYRVEEITSSLRADTSSTQGRDMLKSALIRVMLLPKTTAEFNSKVILESLPGETFRLIEKQPKFDAFGKLDHWQCDLKYL